MNYDVAFTAEAAEAASDHLLQHYQAGRWQEDLCFALWRPSTGAGRLTALVDRIIAPHGDERALHGNASFTPQYTARAVAQAYRDGAGLALMHSHPGDGWQPMSKADADAERDVLSPPTRATGLPLLGMTVASDGYWSARFWHKDKAHADWCDKVRFVGPKSCQLHYNDRQVPPSPRREILKTDLRQLGNGNSERHRPHTRRHRRGRKRRLYRSRSHGADRRQSLDAV